MMDSLTYGLMTLPFVFLWVILFLKSPDIRGEMWVMSAFFGLAGPISEYWHIRDYWHPHFLFALTVGGWRFGIEDYILTFAMSGTVMALFEKFCTKKEWGPLPPVSWRCLFGMCMIGGFGILLMILFASIIRMNSIYAILLTLFVVSAFIFWKRVEWIRRALAMAFAFSIFYCILFRFIYMPAFPGIFERWWNLDALWGVRLGGVPLEEPVWSFAAALFAGPVYRFCSEGRMKKVG
jgi:hypothetical protein